MRFNFILNIIFFVFAYIINAASINDGPPLEIESNLRRPLITARATEENLLVWVNDNIFTPPTRLNKCTEHAFTGLGVINALSRGAVYFKLGYDLGPLLVPYATNEGARIVFQVFYGLGCSVSMAFLGKESFEGALKKHLVNKYTVHADLEKQYTTLQKISLFTSKWIALPVISSSSAAAFTGLTYFEFKDILKWGWIVPGISNFLGRGLLDYQATPEVLGLIYRELSNLIPFYRRGDYSYSRYERMRRRLDESKEMLFSINDEAYETLRREFEAKDTSLQRKLQILFNPSDLPESNPHGNWNLRKVVGLLGGVFGAAGLWIYYPTTVNTFNALFTACGLNTENMPALSQILTTASLISASPVLAKSSTISTLKFWDAGINLGKNIWNKCTASFNSWWRHGNDTLPLREEREIINTQVIKHNRHKALSVSIATIFGLWSASQQVELAFQTMDLSTISSQIIFAAAAMATFSIAFWPVDAEIMRRFEGINPRVSLTKYIDKLILQLANLSEESLSVLESIVAPSLT